jgi:hypothetical protein
MSLLTSVKVDTKPPVVIFEEQLSFFFFFFLWTSYKILSDITIVDDSFVNEVIGAQSMRIPL